MNLRKKLSQDKLALISMNALIKDYACDLPLSLEGSLSEQCTKAGVNRTQIYEKKRHLERALEKVDIGSPGRPAHRQYQVSFEERKTDKECFVWMQGILQGKTKRKELEDELCIDKEGLEKLHDSVLNKPLNYRNRAMVALAHLKKFPPSAISRFLCIQLHTVCDYINRLESEGVDTLLGPYKRKGPRKFELGKYKEAVFRILHAPPSSYGINRTTWRLDDLGRILRWEGFPISRTYICQIIKETGYRYLKVKRVLTSPDPDYREKVKLLLDTLHNLRKNELLFFIDELGPLRVRKYGGRTYMKKQAQTVPQVQPHRGSITLAGALSATANQVSWFFSDAKDTSSMVDLIELLFNQHNGMCRIYVTWDAASWHRSQDLFDWLDAFNRETVRRQDGPTISLIPLPVSAQFLDVIEAVFSGMKRAVIHHSDYRSTHEMKSAISTHFKDRNDFFKQNPRRAGKKIWDIDFFEDHDKLLSGNYREW